VRLLCLSLDGLLAASNGLAIWDKRVPPRVVLHLGKLLAASKYLAAQSIAYLPCDSDPW